VLPVQNIDGITST